MKLKDILNEAKIDTMDGRYKVSSVPKPFDSMGDYYVQREDGFQVAGSANRWNQFVEFLKRNKNITFISVGSQKYKSIYRYNGNVIISGEIGEIRI